MSFLDVFKSERIQRQVYGIAKNTGMKLYILSYLLLKVADIDIQHKLLALYNKYNTGSYIIFMSGIGYSPITGGGETISGIDQTISRTISIPQSELSGVGTLEQQIAEFINANGYTKGGEDAEVWVDIT